MIEFFKSLHFPVTMILIASLGLLAKHVDDLSYDVAKFYMDTAIVLAMQGGENPPKPVVDQIEKLKDSAKRLCLRSFISTAMIPGPAGRCSNLIKSGPKEGEPAK